MRSKILPFLVAALVQAFATHSFAGSPASDAKAAVSTTESAWSSTILGFGVKTNDNYTDGNVFLTVPLYSTIGRDGKLGGDYLFIEPYSSVGTGGEVAASLGLAWRHLFSDQSVAALHNKGEASFMEEGWFLGGNLFVDMLNTQHDNQFWQLGVGAEIGNRYLQLSGNYYIPLSGRELAERNVSTQSFSNTSNSTKLTAAGDPFATGNAILQDATYTTYANTTTTTVRTVSELFEQGMEGWDVQLAVLVPWLDQWVDLKLIGGYFSFDNQPFGPQSFGTGNVHGWKVGTEFRPVPAVVLSAMWYQDERLTGNDWTVGVQLQVPLGKDWRDSFRMRRRHLVEDLAEPVHRQNDAVKIGNEEEHHSSTSVKHVTRVVKQTATQLVLKDDIIFVNNGGDVGNGIKTGSAGGTGKAEAPVDTVQTGANLAGTNSSSTNRLWTAYVQGGAANYAENVVVTTGSVDFVASGPRGGIPGVGGKTFGIQGASPVIDGRISANGDINPLIKTIGIRGFIMQDASDLISMDNIASLNIQNNLLRNSGDDAIVVNNYNGGTFNTRIIGNTVENPDDTFIDISFEDAVIASALISGNTVSNTADRGVQASATGDAQVLLQITGNNFTNIGNSTSLDTIDIQSNQNSRVFSFITGNTITNASGDGVQAEAYDSSIQQLTVSQNTINGTGDDGIYFGSFDAASLQVAASGNTITGASRDGIYLTTEITGFMNAVLSGNTITSPVDFGIHYDAYDSTTALITASGNTITGTGEQGIGFHGFDKSDTNVSALNNTITNAGTDGIRAFIEEDLTSPATMTFFARGNTINTPGLAGIVFKAFNGGTMDATVENNTINNSVFEGIFSYADTGANLTGAITGNTINNAGFNGIHVESHSDTTVMIQTITGNRINDSNGDAVNAQSYDKSSLTLNVLGNDFHNASDDYINPQSYNGSTLTFTAANNAFHSGDESGIQMDSAGTSTFNYVINANSIENNIFRGIYATARDTSVMTGDITNNFINNNPGGVDLNAFDTATLNVLKFDNNSIFASSNPGVGITLQSFVGATLSVNGTVNNVVGPFFFGRLSGSFFPTGSFILNGATINLPDIAP